MTVRRGAVSTAAALLIGGASFGCSSDGDKAAPLPSLSSTPTPSSPAFPKTREGAAAFVRSFYGSYNAALADASLIQTFQSMASSACHSCSNIIGFLQRGHRNGASVDGGQITVVSAVAPPFDGSSAVVTTSLKQAGGKVVDRAGKQVIAIPRVERDVDELRLMWQGSGWIVTQITSFGNR